MTITYQDYLREEKIFESSINKKNRRHVNERRFNKTRDRIEYEIKNNNYSSRVDAEKDLEIKIQQMNPITFILFRLLIGWLIDKLLDAYFSTDQTI
jgi:F0F1-type ATP synthase assembly protein I